MDISALNKPADLTEGKWIDNIPDNPGLRLRVRSQHFKPYRVAVAALSRTQRKELRTAEGLDSFSVAIGGPLADHILLDWAGVTSSGKPVPYSKETAKALLTADDPHGIGAGFRGAVQYASESVADELAEVAEDIAGN